MIRFLIILCLIVFFNSVFAQHPTYSETRNDYTTKFERYNTESGLSHNKCITTYQDQYGYLWIGTANGLNRFDGYKFINYINTPGDSTSISGNFISDITEDIYGNLWIATQNGLNLFNRENETFERYFNEISQNSLSDNNIRQLLVDSTGNLWIETLDGVLNKFNIKAKTFTHYQHKKIIQPFYNYYGMFLDKDGLLWLGGRNFGPCYYDQQTETFTYFETRANTKGKKRDPDVACYFIDSENTFWISGIDGIYSLNRETEYFSKFLGTSTYSIIQTKDGDVWFATGKGTFKFNYVSKILTHYINDENNPFSIIDDHVNEVFQDKDENIWFATDAGLCKLNYQQNMFGHIYHIPENKNSLASNKISSITEDNKGNLWIAFENKGFDKYNLKSQTFEHFQNKTHPELKSDYVSKLYFDKNWNLWIGLWRGVGFNIFNPQTKEFKHYAFDPHTRKRDWYADFLEDKTGTNWVGIWGAAGLHQFDTEKGKFLSKTFKPLNRPLSKQINKLFIDNRNNLWIGCKNQIIYKYSLESNTFHSYIYRNFPLSEEKVKNLKIKKENFNRFNEIISISSDKSGNIWFITKNEIINYISSDDRFTAYSCKNYNFLNTDYNGIWFTKENSLEFFSFNEKKFTDFHTDISVDLSDIKKILPYNNKDDFLLVTGNKIIKYPQETITYSVKESKNLIKEVFTDSNNKIWIFTNDKLVLIDEDSNTLDTDKFNIKLKGIEIYSFYEDTNQTIWLGTNNGLYKIEDLNNIAHYIHNPNNQYSILNNKIYSIVEDISNNLWLGTENGLCKFDETQNKFFAYNQPGDDAITSHLTSDLFEDSQGNIWIGTTNKGLNKLNPETSKIQHYTHNTYDSTSISSNTIHCIFEDHNHNVWIGTSEGLNLLKYKQASFKRFYIQDGLPSNSIASIVEDEDGNLWIATSNGLSKYDLTQNQFKNYYETDGLQENSYANASCKLSDGRLVFGGENGINIFNPKNLKFQDNIPEIQITSFKIFNKIVKTDFTSSESIKLNYKENFFTISFSSLSFINPGKQLYYYKLDKIDPDWNKISSDPKASYTDINPGNYTFKVKSVSESGQESNIKTIKIIIKPPFWRTYWFYAFIIIIVLTITSWIIILKFKKFKAEKENLELEQKLLRSQMNPHFIFNALMPIQNFIYSNDSTNADKFLTKFSRLLRLILQNSRATFISIDDEVNTITNYLELQKLRFDDKFNYSVIVDSKIDKESVLIPPMLAQPFIENSIEHGFVDKSKKYNLNIGIWLADKSIIYIIEDDGIGINKSTEIKKLSEKSHKSLGMQITKERMLNLKRNQKQNIELKIEDLNTINSNKQGTRVTLAIQVKN